MKKQKILKYIQILSTIGFVIFLGLYLNDTVYQPYRMKLVQNQTKDLLKKPSNAPKNTYPSQTPTGNLSDASNPIRDEKGRLIYFQDLLTKNPDTIGWLSIPNSNIDYAVVQNNKKSSYYLTHNFFGKTQKSGCLFIEKNSSIEKNPKNVIIFGHNMTSSQNMFHQLMKMKKLDYLKQHSSFTFDTIYQTGQWKIFSIFITNGSDKEEPFFDYTRSTFKDTSDFMNFVYQVRIRSMFHINGVDVNENDQLVTLSTCTYELKDYRLVIVARKERPDEEANHNNSIEVNHNAVYPNSYYARYNIAAPQLPATFEEALDQGLIPWYKK